MLTSSADSWDRIRQTFAEQFEQDGANFVYRRSQIGEAIRVSADERSNFIDGFDRNVRRAQWIIYGGLSLALVGIVLLSLLRDSDFSQIALFAAIGLVMIPYFAYYRWAWAAPARELAGRTPIAGKRSSEEVQRLRFQRISYSQLAGAAFGGLVIPYVGSAHQDVFSGWNRLWLAFGGALILLAALQAFRKWRFEQGDSFRKVIPQSSTLGTTEQAQDSTSRIKGQLWRYVPFAVVLLALAFIALTPAGKRLAQTPSFWPIVLLACGNWSLFTVAQGFTKGQIEPFARGFYNTYQRETQPKRFWASLAWNALFGALCLWLAFTMTGQVDEDRCYDWQTVYTPQEELAACNEVIGKQESGDRLADLIAARGTAYYRLGDYRRASADYTSAIRLNPKDSYAHFNRGLVYERLGDLARAIEDYSAAIRLRGDDADAYFNRGLIFLDTGKFDQAVADFTRAHELKPKDPWALANRGMAYAWKRDQARAEEDFKEVRALEPSNPVMLRGEALLSFDAGDMQSAVTKLTAALKSKPGNRWSLRMRAEAYRQLGKEEEAEADQDELWRLSKAAHRR